MTRIGVGATLLGISLTVVGLVLVWPPFVVLGIGLIMLVIVALAYIVRRPQLVIERQIHPPRVSKGLPAIAYLNFSNRGRSTVPATVATQPYGATSIRTVLPRLARGQSGVRTYRLPTTQRGIFAIGPVEITRLTRSSSSGSPNATPATTTSGSTPKSSRSARCPLGSPATSRGRRRTPPPKAASPSTDCASTWSVTTCG